MSPELIAAVRQQAPITELFAPGELRRAGRDFLATCPWHNDRHPSLTVSADRNRVFCFVCSRGEDVIGWLQQRQGCSFPEAVTTLARRIGLPLPAEDPTAAARQAAERQERQRLLHWRAELQQRFQRALGRDLERNGPAAGYLRQRGLAPELARAWGLGLHQGRLMLPIRDGQGRCCGFSGRLIAASAPATATPAPPPATTTSAPAPAPATAPDTPASASDGAANPPPKYKNSAADALFQRNRLLFGLDRAAAAIRRSGEALLVEGPLDVLQLHQAGIENAVAALGTSLSPTQRQLLQRAGARRLIVAFDGDQAGERATARLLAELRPLAISGELELAVLPLPAGADPDALLRREGVEAMDRRLRQACHWLHWELQRLMAPALAAPEDLAVLQRCDRQAAQLLALLPAGPLRRRAEERLHAALGAVPQAPLPPGRQLGESFFGGPPLPSLRLRAERRALRLYLCSAECRPLLDPLEFSDPLCRQALSLLRQLNRRLQGLPAAAVEPWALDGLGHAVLALTPRLDPPLAGLLEDMADCGVDARRIIRATPEPELQAVLEVLEPVDPASAAPAAEPTAEPEPTAEQEPVAVEPEPSAEPVAEAMEPAVRPAGPATVSQEHPGPSAAGATSARPPPVVRQSIAQR